MTFFAKYREQYVANLRLAIPVALSQLGYIATTFADNAMVGAYGGADTTPLSAVSFGGIIGYIIYFFGLGITLGITPLVGEIFVRGDRLGSARYLQSAILLYSLLGIVLAALLCPRGLGFSLTGRATFVPPAPHINVTIYASGGRLPSTE